MSEPVALSRNNANQLRKSLAIREVDGPVIGAVDHGGTNPRFGVFDWDGNPLLLRPGTDEIMAEGLGLDLPTYEAIPRDCDGVGALPCYTKKLLRDTLKPLAKKFKVKCLGYAVAGPVTEDGIQVIAPNIWGPDAPNVPWRKMVEEALAMRGRVAHGNDMWAAANDIIARGPHADPAYDVESFIVITVSSGVGSKVVRKRVVDLGVDGLAGEIGHMPILWPDEIIPGRRCGCGRLYCLEAGASGNSNAHRAKAEAERLWRQVSASPSVELIETINAISLQPGEDLDERVKAINKAVVEAAKSDDPLGREILRRAIRPIARAVASLESQLNIRNFYFVGGFALAIGQLFLDILRAQIHDMGGINGRSDEMVDTIGRLYPDEAQEDEDKAAHDWGLRGAALAARLRFLPEKPKKGG